MSHHWEGLEPNPEKYHGFLYLITHPTSGMKYVGKKAFHSVRRVKVPGKTRRKIVVKPNNWEYYTGSSHRLNDFIREEGGTDDFKFIILGQYVAKGDLYYSEIVEQVKRGVMTAKLPNGDEEYFNRQISGIKFVPPCKESCYLEDDQEIRHQSYGCYACGAINGEIEDDHVSLLWCGECKKAPILSFREAFDIALAYHFNGKEEDEVLEEVAELHEEYGQPNELEEGETN